MRSVSCEIYHIRPNSASVQGRYVFFLRVKDNFNTPRQHEEGSNDLLMCEGAAHLQSNPKLHRGFPNNARLITPYWRDDIAKNGTAVLSTAIPSYRCSGRVSKQSQLSQQLYFLYSSVYVCNVMYIHIHRQAMHWNIACTNVCAPTTSYIYIYIIDLCRSESYSGTHMYIYIQYISKMKKKKNKLRYFDHTCRSGILYTVMCITFLSRAKVCRSSAFV